MQTNEISTQKRKGARLVIEVERPSGIGSVPGLDDDELADPEELERWVKFQEWGPILALPVRRRNRWISPSVDESGHLNYGAFDTMDSERFHGEFDRARYEANKLRDELDFQVIMLSVLMERIPGRAKYMVLRHLNTGVIDLDHIEDPNMHALARRHLRCQRLRHEIRLLREVSSWRRACGLVR